MLAANIKKDPLFFKRFFSMMFTIAMQNLIVFGVSLADNLMLGGYSESALSGAALVNQIQFLLQMVIMGIGEGMIVLMSQYWGKRELEPIRDIAAIGFRIAVVSGALLNILMFLFPEEVLGLLTDQREVIAEGVYYVRVVCFSYVFFSMTNILLSALRSVETVKIAFAVSISTFLINCCLNYLLIYGNFGCPRLGAAGAAAATLTSRVVEFLITVWYLKFKDKKLCLHLRDIFRRNRALLFHYLRIGSPVILSNAVWGTAMAIQTAILGHLGGPAIAANSIATTIFQIITVFGYGASSATSVLTGKSIGEYGTERIKQYAKTLQVIYLIIGILSGLLLFSLRDLMLGFYTISPEAKAMAAQFMTVLSITVVGTAYQVPCLTGLVRGGGDTKFVLINDSIFMWLIVIPSASVMAFLLHMAPVWVFLALKSDQILKCFVAVVKVNRGNWARQLTSTNG